MSRRYQDNATEQDKNLIDDYIRRGLIMDASVPPSNVEKGLTGAVSFAVLGGMVWLGNKLTRWYESDEHDRRTAAIENRQQQRVDRLERLEQLRSQAIQNLHERGIEHPTAQQITDETRRIIEQEVNNVNDHGRQNQLN